MHSFNRFNRKNHLALPASIWLINLMWLIGCVRNSFDCDNLCVLLAIVTKILVNG